MTHIKLKGLNSDIKLGQSASLSKESLIYMINNENTTSAIYIHLQSAAYTRLSVDLDVTKALANHPNISITQYW